MITQQYRTHQALIGRIYSNQIHNSKQREHNKPNYTKEELTTWLLNQDTFHELFTKWKQSNYAKDLTPSCDRLHDDKCYSLNNLQVTTWLFNHSKQKTKDSKLVIQHVISTNEVITHSSVTQASKYNKCSRGSIYKTCSTPPNLFRGSKFHYALDD